MKTLFPEKTAFLATVLSAEESKEALYAGASVIDVKNPAEGALGAASPKVIASVRQVIPKEIHLSAAIGDMPYLPGTAALAALGAAKAGATIIKVGLLGTKTTEEVFLLLQATASALADHCPKTALVAGAYADAKDFSGVDPLEIPAAAASAGAAGCLLDTFDKMSGRRLPDVLSFKKIEVFLASCSEAGLFSALAGSLGPGDIARLLSLKPHFLGFRGALCEGGRSGRFSFERTKEIARLIEGEDICSPRI
ncbi:MAG: (5-formylfuran-3-yl)methyl phosphate synthase [Thermovirgaceae bacterium]